MTGVQAEQRNAEKLTAFPGFFNAIWITSALFFNGKLYICSAAVSSITINGFISCCQGYWSVHLASGTKYVSLHFREIFWWTHGLWQTNITIIKVGKLLGVHQGTCHTFLSSFNNDIAVLHLFHRTLAGQLGFESYLFRVWSWTHSQSVHWWKAFRQASPPLVADISLRYIIRNRCNVHIALRTL